MTRAASAGAWRIGLALLAICCCAGAVAADADRAARYDYLLHCSGCHRVDGAGAPPEVPTLRGPVGRLLATAEGRAYVVRVPEVAQSPLGDAALARLLNWMLREFNADTLPKGFRPMQADEVAAARRRVLADPLRARAAIAYSEAE